MRSAFPAWPAAALAALVAAVALVVPLPASVPAKAAGQEQPAADRQPDPRERHLANLRMLTNGGENAEAYFSFDGRRLIFQATRPGAGCDQIYTMNADGSDRRMVSTGQGRTTCAFFYPGGQSILYGSTHLASPDCPPKPGFERGYVWPIYAGYDIFRANAGRDRPRAPDLDARVRRRSHHRARRPDRLHQRPRRRHGDLLDERRRVGRAAPDAPAGPDGGPFYSAGRALDRLPRADARRRVRNSTTTGRC